MNICFAIRLRFSEDGRHVPLPDDSPRLTGDPPENVEDAQEKEKDKRSFRNDENN